MTKKRTIRQRTKVLCSRPRAVPPIERVTRMVETINGRLIPLSLPRLRFMEKEDGV